MAKTKMQLVDYLKTQRRRVIHKPSGQLGFVADEPMTLEEGQNPDDYISVFYPYPAPEYRQENIQNLDLLALNEGESEDSPDRELTLGEKTVRSKFNPSGSGNVNFFKNMVAKAIDVADTLRDVEPRLAAITITKFEEAGMFAVKLATTDK